MTFFTEFLRNPRQNASIVPSAPAACEKMFEGLDMSAMEYVVELGPGTGCFTKELMAQLPASAEVLMLEINPTFCPKLGRVRPPFSRAPSERPPHGRSGERTGLAAH